MKLNLYSFLYTGFNSPPHHLQKRVSRKLMNVTLKIYIIIKETAKSSNDSRAHSLMCRLVELVSALIFFNMGGLNIYGGLNT